MVLVKFKKYGLKEISILQRLKLLFLAKLLVGVLLFTFFDKLFGVLILIAGLITLIWIIKLKNTKYYGNSLSYLHVAIGVLMLTGALSIFFIGGSNVFIKIIIKTSIGLFLLTKGIIFILKTD